ncbi:MAG: hypothetical protein LZ167_08120 [Thaumarchaeota archaeon]|jgi:hypothetical protein|nr:hypothetical protein [Candidatus Geocrenenecus arthurdayi]
MAEVYYVDVSRTAVNGKGRQKLHYAFDGEKILKIRRLTKLKDASEIFIDSLFPENYNEILELLRKDTKIYLLKDTGVLKKLRKENNLRKSDEVDALMLSKIPREYFRELTAGEVELKVAVRPLVNRYEWIVEKRKILKQWKNRGYDYGFGESIRAMEADRLKISREIIGMINRSIYRDVYRRVCSELQVKDSVEVAILVLELPLTSGMDKLKSYLGFTPTKNDGRYSHRLRRHLESIASNIYLNSYKRKTNIPEELLETIRSAQSKSIALQKLQLKILKTLRKTWVEVSKEANDKPAGR